MEEVLEVSARTVEEAIKKALEQLGVSREEVDITILNEGKAGVFGIGAQEASIRVKIISGALKSQEPSTPKINKRSEVMEPSKDVAEIARGVVETLLSKIGVNATVASIESITAEEKAQEQNIVFEIRGEDLGILIGRQGQTLASLQYIVRLITSQIVKSWVPVVIDVEGYKQHRVQGLREMALQIAERVTLKRTPFKLEPMPAYERRVIHLTLANHPDVTTQSSGEGEFRRVTVMPKNK